MSAERRSAGPERRRLRICLLCVEIFAWGKYGGFGRATRTIGRELARAGHDVTAVVPRRQGQAEQETLDGIRVLGYPRHKPWVIHRLARAADADVYHSCEPSLATYLARRAMPRRRHVITVRDPRTVHDWRIEMALPSLNRFQVATNFLFEHNSLVASAVRRSDAVYTAYRDAVPKVRRMYRLAREPQFLPTPVAIPALAQKQEQPSVCYIGRLDRRKRPELLIPLASRFPQVEFNIAGWARDKTWETALTERLGALPNVRMLGFVDQFRSPVHAQTLAKSWVLVNTSAREGLPNTFIEAAANGCAILSSNNPDGFASRFGEHVRDADFGTALGRLLEGQRWRSLGLSARDHVSSTFATDVAIQRHIAAYDGVLAADGGDG